MKKQPIIGITCGIDSLDNQTLSLRKYYLEAVAALGGIPILLPPLKTKDLQQYLALTDGLILSGGGDIHPSYWQEAPAFGSKGQVDPARDSYELAIAKLAMASDKPLLGICRGMQVINVACGGSLYQDLGANFAQSIEHNQNAPKDQLWHEVFAMDENFRHIMGQDRFFVNSFHHQAIKKLGANLKATAKAGDGILEAIAGLDHRYLVGVQWHPERLYGNHQPSYRLFSDFIQAAKA